MNLLLATTATKVMSAEDDEIDEEFLERWEWERQKETWDRSLGLDDDDTGHLKCHVFSNSTKILPFDCLKSSHWTF